MRFWNDRCWSLNSSFAVRGQWGFWSQNHQKQEERAESPMKEGRRESSSCKSLLLLWTACLMAPDLLHIWHWHCSEGFAVSDVLGYFFSRCYLQAWGVHLLKRGHGLCCWKREHQTDIFTMLYLFWLYKYLITMFMKESLKPI